HRQAEKALNLRGVKVHRHDTVSAGGLDGIRTHARADRDARLILFIALGIGEVRDDGRYRLGAGAVESVAPKEQLHEVVVRGKRRGLHEVDVAAAHVFEDAHEQIALGKLERLALAWLDIQVLANARGELAASGSAEHQDL